MDLTASYMGIKIKNPLIVGSSGLTITADNVVKCAQAGAGAVVLKSLFEEQLIADKNRLLDQDDMYFWHPEAMDQIGTITKEHGTDAYLRLIESSKKAVDIPVFASLNCITAEEWPIFAKKIENSGADGIELNIFIPPTQINAKAQHIESTYFEIIKAVRSQVTLPLSVKIGHFFTNLAGIIYQVSKTGVQSIVLFNRYYRPDIDINKLKIITGNVYSSPEEITLALRWIALLSSKVECELVASTGIYGATGAIKYLLAGASSVQLCSVLYKNKLLYIETIISDIVNWMEKMGYKSINDFRGIISKQHEAEPVFDRVQFIRKTTGKL
jgi:dihydroorotate dehydrogenase (fumarate)